MPCRCAGIQVSKCSCQVLSPALVKNYLTNNQIHQVSRGRNGNELKEDVIKQSQPSFYYRVLERFYEKCAGYNLRYCYLRSTMGKERYLSNIIKELIILICFFIANFIVMTNILTRITFNLFRITVETIYWIQRVILTRDTSNELTIARSSLQN